MSPTNRNSAHWMPDIKKLCAGFCEKRLNPRNLNYRENVFSTIDEYCNDLVDKIKNEIYFNHPNATDCLLDHHKIAAVHILGILKNQPFEKVCLTTDDKFFDVLPNEHYCFLLLQVILIQWRKINNKTVNVNINIPAKYKDCLLLLFRKYKNSRSPQTDDIMFAYALSNIVYLIETHFVA